MSAIPKGSPDEMLRQLASTHGDRQPIVLTLTLGEHYSEEQFAPILTYLATSQNFRGVAVLDKDKRLIAYWPARQIVWLSSITCTELRNQLLGSIAECRLEDIQNHVAMTNVHVSLGSTFAETLHRCLRENLTGIAVVNDAQRLYGIVDRDRLVGSLLLSLTRSAQGKPADVPSLYDRLA